jgi:hypothetical protein
MKGLDFEITLKLNFIVKNLNCANLGGFISEWATERDVFPY